MAELVAVPLLVGETWLICGGRDFANHEMFDAGMGQLVLHRGGVPEKVVHGAASGADTMASQWAQRMALEEVAVPADWKRHGRAAGPVRNQKMLDDHRPDVVIAFPGGRGTEDMIARARKVKSLDIFVIKVKYDA